MTKNMEAESRLVSLFEDALSAGEELLSFTQLKYPIFLADDDVAMSEALKEREGYIDALTSLENDIDLILDETGLSYDSLPPEAEKIRSSIQSVLSKVTCLDTDAINILSSNLQKYKNYTIQARSKKQISAYIQANAGASLGGNLDRID